MDDNEEFEVECGECGESLTLELLQFHKCSTNIQGPSESEQTGRDSHATEDDNLVLRLAEAVQARPALWDHTLPLKERGKDIKEKLWKEVCAELNGMIPLEKIEKKWKNLKDTFLKHLKTYTPSGSGSNEKKKWKHFDAMYFLAEKNNPKKTYGNVPLPVSSPSSSGETGIHSRSITPEVPFTSSGKRKRSVTETEDLLLGILKEQPPKIPEQTLSPALMTVQSILEKLPTQARMQAEIEILNQVYALYAKCSNPE